MGRASVWQQRCRAVLVLDALSLRELPWLPRAQKERGFTRRGVTATASELPGETNEFARTGFGQLQPIAGQRRRFGAQANQRRPKPSICRGKTAKAVGSASRREELGVLASLARRKLPDYGAGQGWSC